MNSSTTGPAHTKAPARDTDSAMAKGVDPQDDTRTEPASARDVGRGAPRARKRDVHGWLVLDKPVGETSTFAVAVAKRAFNARKAGHAGTLDPLASGILPIALGEATKTVPYVMDGRKAYRFTVTWGAETATDDAEGEVIARSDLRPTAEAIHALLGGYIGTVMQVPPRFSAIKVSGERAYDLARDGEQVVLPPRPVEIDRLELMAHEGETSVFEADCGKGTYVRAIARDLGRELGCHGHVTALRRTRVGPFHESDAVAFGMLEAARDGQGADPVALLQPVAAALTEVAMVHVSRHEAGRLARGQSVLLRGAEAPLSAPDIAVFCQGALVAIGEVDHGELFPRRVFVSG